MATSVIGLKEKEAALKSLRERCEACQECVMHETRLNVVHGEGNPDAKIVIVGEAPGEKEDMNGRPFQGSAGERLNGALLPLAGLSRKDVYITNACKCRPIDGGRNRKPSLDEQEACRPFLIEELKVIEPDLIITLGAPALCALVDKAPALRDCHGKVIDSNLGIKLYPTYHPSPKNWRFYPVQEIDFRNLEQFAR